jgi:hypothetical protein
MRFVSAGSVITIGTPVSEMPVYSRHSRLWRHCRYVKFDNMTIIRQNEIGVWLAKGIPILSSLGGAKPGDDLSRKAEIPTTLQKGRSIPT